MGLKKRRKNIQWSPHREANGEIHHSRCGRFCLIQGSEHFSLLEYGILIRRDTREDLLIDFAEARVNEEKRS